MDKHYLAELGERGVRTVPTRFFERETQVDLGSALEEQGYNVLFLALSAFFEPARR